MKRPGGTAPARAHHALFGAIPVDATHWSCRRRSGGVWSWLRHTAGDGVAIREWPIDELSVDALRSRWGAGEFKVQWLGLRDGQRVPLGHSRIVQLTPEAESRPVTKKRLVRTEPAPTTADSVNAVVSLWNVAQAQAATWAHAHEAHAERTVERERAFFSMQLEQQRAFFNEMDRLRREASTAAPTSTNDGVLAALQAIANKLEDAPGGDEDAWGDEPSKLETVQRIVETVGQTWMPALGPALGGGAGALLMAVAGWVQSRTPATDPAPSLPPAAPTLDSPRQPSVEPPRAGREPSVPRTQTQRKRSAE